MKVTCCIYTITCEACQHTALWEAFLLENSLKWMIHWSGISKRITPLTMNGNGEPCVKHNSSEYVRFCCTLSLRDNKNLVELIMLPRDKRSADSLFYEHLEVQKDFPFVNVNFTNGLLSFPCPRPFRLLSPSHPELQLHSEYCWGLHNMRWYRMSHLIQLIIGSLWKWKQFSYRSHRSKKIN